MLDAEKYHEDTSLMVALDSRLGDGPHPDYPTIDLSDVQTMAELVNGITAHLKTCARLMGQTPAEVLVTEDRAFKQLEDTPAEAVLLSWEGGPPNWGISDKPLGMRLPQWAFAEPYHSFDLVVTDRRITN